MKKFIKVIVLTICVTNLTAFTKNDIKHTVPEVKSITQTPSTNKYEAAGIDNPAEFEKTFNDVKAAIEKDEKETVADYINYPLNVNETSKDNKVTTTKIKSKEDFIKNYDSIITGKVKKSMINQKVEDTFVNYQGVMVGDGEIWFKPISNQTDGSVKYLIITVNK